jgi:hypothetical protein
MMQAGRTENIINDIACVHPVWQSCLSSSIDDEVGRNVGVITLGGQNMVGGRKSQANLFGFVYLKAITLFIIVVSLYPVTAVCVLILPFIQHLSHWLQMGKNPSYNSSLCPIQIQSH